MRRRTWAGLVAVALAIGFSIVAHQAPVPYVTSSPGLTVNVLGTYQNEDIISVSGRKSYRDNGALRLTTVVLSGPDANENKVSIPQLVIAWLDPEQSVSPREAIYPESATRKSVEKASSEQMVSSQDAAVAAALRVLEIPFTSGVQISAVEKGGPADGKLKAGDVVVSIDGTEVDSLEALTRLVRSRPIGSEVSFVVQRKDAEREVTLTTTSSPLDARDSAVRVGIAPCCYEFPFEVELNLAQNIGGPSGGLMFALGIYDVLTPGSLTDGKVIAGTGEIDPQGRVGGIGGIQQKLVGAQDDGARLFLVPAANCAEALDGHYDPEKMRLVKVTTLNEAIADVQAWVKDPDAELARCTR